MDFNAIKCTWIFIFSSNNKILQGLIIKKYCILGEAEQQLVKQAMKQYNFSGRSLHRILKVARTIADLAGMENIVVNHLAEAVQYRPKTE